VDFFSRGSWRKYIYPITLISVGKIFTMALISVGKYIYPFIQYNIVL
jgi:hypothetical protein